MFQDDLLVRSPNGFELTLRGRKLLDELNRLLPKMEQLVVPNVFDPAGEPTTFRLSAPDNVCSALRKPWRFIRLLPRLSIWLSLIC
jgi:DNA-binding transcriptional LysR family regulator